MNNITGRDNTLDRDISKYQLRELDDELCGHEELIESVLMSYKITGLSHLKERQFIDCIVKIKRVKQKRKDREFFRDAYQFNEFFSSPIKAIDALYEQLFDSRPICKETILKSMQYLVLEAGMYDHVKEIADIYADDIAIGDFPAKEKNLAKNFTKIKD